MVKTTRSMPQAPDAEPSHEHQVAPDPSHDLLLREAAKIVTALGRMLAPICEVVLHDLRNPDSAILAIENPLSGRTIGEATTEMGLARVRDPAFPDVVQNYQNRLPGGRRAKSTSIGIRDANDTCIAAICLNMDLSLIDAFQTSINQLGSVIDQDIPVAETLRVRSHDAIREMVHEYAANVNAHPHALDVQQRREVCRKLSDAGLLQLRGAQMVLADVLGVGRSTVYNIMKSALPHHGD